ncbi:MAG TPA: ABC transporter ATP-binding protein [Mycobacteriales bacterium]|nr:ABC transporter ATP-binding protein [Mycobacteriales bacterium]
MLAVAGALALARLALQIPAALIPARITSEVQRSLRTQLLEAFTSTSWAVQAADREGHFQELMSNQITQCSLSAVQATTLLTNSGMAFMLLLSSVALNPVAAGIIVVISVVLFAFLRPLSAAGKQAARRLAASQLAHSAQASEASRLAEETHVFGVGAAQRAEIGIAIDDVRDQFRRAQLMLRLVPGIYQSMIYILLVLGLLAVDRFVHGGLATLGAVVLLLVRAASYGNMMQSNYQALRQSLPYVSNVRSAETAYRSSIPHRGQRPLESISLVRFDDVGYAYSPDRGALEHVSFEVHEGQAIGIVGPSGSGKSTLSQLLLQLREPTHGQYLINNYPAREYREHDWHRLVAYVPQTPNLIHATLADNIKYYREFSEADVERAARLAGIHDDIVSWADGYETLVGPRADAVSGGQAQRICIARAVVGRPKLLLLDEPTSAVDLRSERIIQESLLALKGEVTLFIIAHRLSTLDMCDRVMVVMDGQLDAFAPLASLKDHSAYFAAVSATQHDAEPADANRE